jgi:sec-independent protein translocase protein TatC
MAEEPGETDESPDGDAPEEQAQPADGAPAVDTAPDSTDRDDEFTSAVRRIDETGEDGDEADVGSDEADDGGDEAVEGSDEQDVDGDDRTADTGDRSDDEFTPAVRRVGDAEGGHDGDEAERPDDADETADGFTPAVREIGDGADEDDRLDLAEVYADREQIETPPARPGHDTADGGDEGEDGAADAEEADDVEAPLAGEAHRAATEDVPASDGGEASEASRASSDAPASDGGYAGVVVHDDDRVYDDDADVYDPGSAPDDEEMPLADHIEEMVRRLGVVVVVMALVSGPVFLVGEDIINFLWFSYLPGELAQCPGDATAAAASAENPGPPYCARVYHPLGLILARLKAATLVGFIVALPVFVYETYLFMRPGLFPHERRYYLASVPASMVLAAAGVAFAHFLVIPAIFTYFLRYSERAAGIAFGLTETFDLMVLLMGGFALVFQIPLFIMLALMMNLVTRRWLHDRRLLFWGAFAGIAFLFSPDPTGMAPIIVAATMIGLFEGTLLLAKWTGRG